MGLGTSHTLRHTLHGMTAEALGITGNLIRCLPPQVLGGFWN
jgi:hypothetical protein